MISDSDLKDIKQKMLDLQMLCYHFGLPMVAVVQYEGEDPDDQRYYVQKSLTPALVNYDDPDSLIYDITCLLSQNFRLVPKGETNDFDDDDEVSMEMDLDQSLWDESETNPEDFLDDGEGDLE